MARKEVIGKLKETLLRRREALRKMQTMGDEEQEITSDMDDRSVLDVINYVSIGTRGNISLELQEIDIALERIQEGSYGNCKNCEGEIPMARLQALPYASNCIRCQRKIGRQIRNVFDIKRPAFNFSDAEDPNESDLPSAESVE